MRILGLVLTLGLLLGLSAYAMSSIDKQDSTKHGTGVSVLPGGIVVPDTDPQATPTPGGAPGGPLDAARTVACATDAQSLRAAEEQYKVLNDRYADVATLVSQQALAAPSTLYRVVSDDGFASYHLVGLTGCP